MIHVAAIQRCFAAAVVLCTAACAGSGNSTQSMPPPGAQAGGSGSLMAQSAARANLGTLSTDSTSAVLEQGGPAQLAINETQGFGAERLLTFTYKMQFDCVDQAFDDRNYNGVVAAEDPAEFYSPPTCQIGAPSTLSPSGKASSQTDKLFVLVPFFETNPKQPAFSEALGKQLKSLFGFVPDAFKIDPGVPVQCPEPGSPITPFKGKPGTCTMHPLQQDVGPMLSALHLIPPNTILNVPLVNHSHLLDNSQITQGDEWWQIIVVLVKDPSVWPDRSGSHGITSVAKLRAAQAKQLASADVPSNFFLFFSSKVMAHMQGM